MAVRNVAHPSVDDRRAAGGQARERTPPSGHAGWVPAADRPDPVALLEEQNLTREKGAGAPRPDDGLAVHFLPGRGQDHGRQLRDMKGSALVEAMAPVALTFYARICGWTLARAHARSGDPVAIAEYLGTSDAFDTSITDFSGRYADQNERDYQQFVTAIRSGRLEALAGV
jgi:Uncharacterized protein conserved in bacteria (DUF2252)